MSVERALESLSELMRLAAAGPTEPLPPPPLAAPGNGARTISDEHGRRLAEAQYRALIEQIPAVTFVASLSGGPNAIYVSPQIESLLGFTQYEWTSNPVLWWRQTHPDDRKRVSDKFAKTCATGATFRDVFRVLTKTGGIVWVDAEAKLIRDENGELLFLQGVGFDVTEQVRARESREQLVRVEAARIEAERGRAQVEEALRVRDSFLAVAAHELRTPITAILGHAQLARRRIARGPAVPAEQVDQALQVISHQADRLGNLVNQLLDVTRLQTGKFALERNPTDLVLIVQQVIAAARLTTDRHQIYLDTPRHAELDLDALRIEQVFTNLLDNAIKYSPAGGEIEVAIIATGEDVEVSVRDHGVGISPEHRDRIFERFYQGEGKGTVKGLGLGLFISRQVVELHGGQIRAEFPDDGGSRFIVTLRKDPPRIS